MADRKTERLMNLIFALLAARQFLSKEQIRQAIADYRENADDAFERMFERDKVELRELGIAIEVGSNDKYFDDEVGYRIRRSDAELPDIDLTPEEAAVIGLAAQLWKDTGLAGQSTTAVAKLKAAGVEVDPEILRMAEPTISASEPAFDDVLDAVRTRTALTFGYRRPGQPEVTRRLQPWRVLSWHGRWYVGGHDLDRGEPRLFRLSRIVGDVKALGGAGSYTIPDDVDARELARALFPSEPDRSAVLEVTRDRGQELRRRATRIVEGERDTIEVPYSSSWALAEEVAGYGVDVRVVGPDDLRDRVITILETARGPL